VSHPPRAASSPNNVAVSKKSGQDKAVSEERFLSN
jgi:hypothetical protein